MMTRPTIAVIAQGAMGSGVGGRLAENGVDVVTSLRGRSAASAERAAKARMRPVDDAQIAAADIILSILPPSEALPLAERLAPALRGSPKKPLYVDCNAVSTDLVQRIGEVVGATGCPFADGGIIGGPPRAGYAGPAIYISGVPASALAPLSAGGLKIRPIDGPIGAASALKMAYAGISKGLTAIAAASILTAAKYGAAEALHAELADSQKGVLTAITRSVPDMFNKAYRFVGEMEEIGAQSGRASIDKIYRGMAELYQELADDLKADEEDIGALSAFFKQQG
jgi:3-hydroxyisobutyrate dehydrogenase-like beta-hydroxyacid dehydrogenase